MPTREVITSMVRFDSSATSARQGFAKDKTRIKINKVRRSPLNGLITLLPSPSPLNGEVNKGGEVKDCRRSAFPQDRGICANIIGLCTSKYFGFILKEKTQNVYRRSSKIKIRLLPESTTKSSFSFPNLRSVGLDKSTIPDPEFPYSDIKFPLGSKITTLFLPVFAT